MSPAIKGVGVDLIEIDRIGQLIEKHGQRFLERCFTEGERAYCQKFEDPLPHLSARYAAKEAVSKGFGTGIGEVLNWKDIEVVNDPNGQPQVKLSNTAKKAVGEVSIHLSLSHHKTDAIAFVVISD